MKMSGDRELAMEIMELEGKEDRGLKAKEGLS